MPCAKQKEMFLFFLLFVSLFSLIVLVAVVISGELLTEAKIIKPFWMLSAMQLVGTRNVRLGICNANFLHLLFTRSLLPSHSHTRVLLLFLPLSHTLSGQRAVCAICVCFVWDVVALTASGNCKMEAWAMRYLTAKKRDSVWERENEKEALLKRRRPRYIKQFA